MEALHRDDFLMFPRELAPRLHDFLVGLCRRAGFEPRAGDASFHSEWDLQTLADAKLVALAPRAVSRDLPDGLTTVVVADPPDQLQTALIWRTDDSSPANRAFRATALETFASAPGAPAS